MPSGYYTQIEALTPHDPRHVEAWMRLEHGTLDHLDAARFESEVCIANACIGMSGTEESEALARSYNL